MAEEEEVIAFNKLMNNYTINDYPDQKYFLTKSSRKSH